MNRRRWIAPLRRHGGRLLRALPEPLYGHARRLAEKLTYALTDEVHELPPIFHFWTRSYLLPDIRQLGFETMEGFYWKFLSKRREASGVTVTSLAAGDCRLEQQLAERYRASDAPCRFVCADLNGPVLKRARRRIEAAGLGDHFVFVTADLDRWTPPRSDFILAHQSLHHITELERLFDQVASALSDEGLFLSNDSIGRNGHQLWPEALAEFQKFWEQLPPAQRYDHAVGRRVEAFRNIDFSEGTHEGVRAQDILPLLVERFGFRMFHGFANVVLPFVDRRLGGNFDPEREHDRAFIERVQGRDQALLLDGILKPTQMFAAMGLGESHTEQVYPELTPRQCIRWPDAG